MPRTFAKFCFSGEVEQKFENALFSRKLQNELGERTKEVFKIRKKSWKKVANTEEYGRSRLKADQ